MVFTVLEVPKTRAWQRATNQLSLGWQDEEVNVSTGFSKASQH